MSAIVPLEVRVLPIAELRPAPYNPRKALRPTDAAYRKLRCSLEEFGLVEPLVWNELTGRVVGGHARLRILKELGVTEVPVSVVRLTEARERALNVVLNNQEAQGRYDTAKLAALLTELDGLPELPLTGFDAAALANLRYEPAGELPAAGGEPDRVEVTLVTDAATFGRMRQRLDELVGAFDLEAHVRRG
jgi:ParB-like chromosome segregation protein Spo0J